MKKLLILLVLVFVYSGSLFAQLAKSQAVLDDWSETASNAMGESSELDVTLMYGVDIHIQHALTTDATAQDDGIFIIQVSSATSGNEDWQTVQTVSMKTGTPNIQVLGGTEAAAQTVIEVASTTGLYDDDGGRWIFLKNTGAIATSEMLQLVSHVADVSVTVLDGTTNAHDTDDNLWDIADSRSYYVDVFTKKRLRILVDNTLDAGGPQVTWRFSSTSNTGI